MEKVTLYHFMSSYIKITIEAYFEGGYLVIDGYDIGKRVEEYWGDSDYEYSVKIPQAGIDFLYGYLEVEPNNQSRLLQALASRYNSNSCYSDIRTLMEENQIKCEGFSWA
jgi:hypothetical protein